MNQFNRMKLRAIRRHHRNRLLLRWTPIVRWYLGCGSTPPDEAVVQHHVRQRLRTRTPCSCFLCSGYKREPTRQERLQDLSFREELELLAAGEPFEFPDDDGSEEWARKLANEGLNSWLASLPDDDWGDSYEHATPVRYNPETGEFEVQPKDPV